jgi:hypothetical protein
MAAAKPSRPAVKKLEKKLDKAIVAKDGKKINNITRKANAINYPGSEGTTNRAAKLVKRGNQKAKATGKPRIGTVTGKTIRGINGK